LTHYIDKINTSLSARHLIKRVFLNVGRNSSLAKIRYFDKNYFTNEKIIIFISNKKIKKLLSLLKNINKSRFSNAKIILFQEGFLLFKNFYIFV